MRPGRCASGLINRIGDSRGNLEYEIFDPCSHFQVRNRAPIRLSCTPPRKNTNPHTMKHPTCLTQTDLYSFKYRTDNRYHLLAVICALICLSARVVSAATITKADTADNLDQGTSWIGGLPPTSSDVGLFDATLAGESVY